MCGTTLLYGDTYMKYDKVVVRSCHPTVLLSYDLKTLRITRFSLEHTIHLSDDPGPVRISDLAVAAKVRLAAFLKFRSGVQWNGIYAVRWAVRIFVEKRHRDNLAGFSSGFSCRMLTE
jgi:hypothetical protein